VTASGTPAIEQLRRARVPHRVHEYERAERHGRDHGIRPAYGVEAAEALGIEPDRMFKTLVASVDGRLVMAVVPVSGELDLKHLARAVGGRRAVLAAPDAAERATGSVVGGISPLGSRLPLPVVVDEGATSHDTVFVSAGRRGLQVELAPADLIAQTRAQVAAIVRDH
jgi:Cys-tRNA(Pro)/Cys-tRNA(Cys) deacylase